MKDVSFSSGSNSAEVSFQNLTVWFSYRTPIAFSAPGFGKTVRENSWGPTTGKHLNAIDGGDKFARSQRISGIAFEVMLAKVLKSFGLSD